MRLDEQGVQRENLQPPQEVHRALQSHRTWTVYKKSPETPKPLPVTSRSMDRSQADTELSRRAAARGNQRRLQGVGFRATLREHGRPIYTSWADGLALR